jgi:sulfide:quinone oxidoreductase
MEDMKHAVTRKEIVVVGGGLAGLPAACRIKRELGESANVIVIDAKPDLVFTPSLIWVPFGWRTVEQISVPLKPALESRGIEFIQGTVRSIDPAGKTVSTDAGKTSYDLLLLAAGPSLNFGSVPGLGPENGTQDISTPRNAELAAQAWRKFLEDPGAVVVGAMPGTPFLAAAYEFAYNLDYALRRGCLRHKAHITFLTPEPFAGHLGTGGLPRARGMLEWFFRHADIDWVTEAGIESVSGGEVRFNKGSLHLAYDGRFPATPLAGASLPFKYAMILPPAFGSQAVRASGLGNERGFVVVDEFMRHRRHRDIFAAGACVAVASSATGESAAPKTGAVSEGMARTAALNIAAQARGFALRPLPSGEFAMKGILDAGDQGLIMMSDHIYAPSLRRRQMLIPGWWAHWSKVLVEKYFLWNARAEHFSFK